MWLCLSERAGFEFACNYSAQNLQPFHAYLTNVEPHIGVEFHIGMEWSVYELVLREPVIAMV
jgi:hypothetical protein